MRNTLPRGIKVINESILSECSSAVNGMHNAIIIPNITMTRNFYAQILAIL